MFWISVRLLELVAHGGRLYSTSYNAHMKQNFIVQLNTRPLLLLFDDKGPTVYGAVNAEVTTVQCFLDPCHKGRYISKVVNMYDLLEKQDKKFS